jgi:hypothetical protein
MGLGAEPSRPWLTQRRGLRFEGDTIAERRNPSPQPIHHLALAVCVNGGGPKCMVRLRPLTQVKRTDQYRVCHSHDSAFPPAPCLQTMLERGPLLGALSSSGASATHVTCRACTTQPGMGPASRFHTGFQSTPMLPEAPWEIPAAVSQSEHASRSPDNLPHACRSTTPQGRRTQRPLSMAAMAYVRGNAASGSPLSKRRGARASLTFILDLQTVSMKILDFKFRVFYTYSHLAQEPRV